MVEIESRHAGLRGERGFVLGQTRVDEGPVPTVVGKGCLNSLW